MTERSCIDPVTGEVIHDPEILPFVVFLQGRSRTHDELSEGLWDLVSRVRDTGKKGSLQLTVHVEIDKKAGGVLVVSDEIKLKLPEHERPGAFFWVDRNGNLSRQNPQQPELDGLRAVPVSDTDPQNLKELNNG